MRPTGRHVSGHSPNSSGTATEKPLEAPASRGFSFWPKTDERPSPIALARRATMDAAFSDACVRILNVTGCAGQAEPARRMGARQAAISDSRRRGQTGSEILPALLKRLGLAPQYGRSAHARQASGPEPRWFRAFLMAAAWPVSDRRSRSGGLYEEDYSFFSTAWTKDSISSGAEPPSPSRRRPSAMISAPSSLPRASITSTAPQKCS